MNPVPVDLALKETLEAIAANDTNYNVREGLVLQAMAMAHTLGLKTGIRHDPDEPEWPVVFIELPTGQVSWHMPQHETPWDGHTTEEKFARIQRFIGGAEK